jgi:hypothetical protein
VIDLTERPYLRVGGRRVRFDLAQRWVADYVTGTCRAFAHRAYDRYRDEVRFRPLDDADLLAPALLGALDLPVTAFSWLQGRTDDLNAALSAVPVDANLADDGPDTALLGPLFAVLDDLEPAQRKKDGIRMSVLSKVLHRKRPGFIPLWNKCLRRCYMETPEPRVRLYRDRSYQEWSELIGASIREDLQEDRRTWRDLANFPTDTLLSDTPLTELRALDIVAWHLGKNLDHLGDPELLP